MDYKELKVKMENIFKSLGFKTIKVNDIEYFVHDNYYCKLTYLDKLSAFVIESTDSYQELENGVLEDGDLYFTDIPEKDLLIQFRDDLINYYFS